MHKKFKVLTSVFTAVSLLLAGCSSNETTETTAKTSLDTIDMSKWQYNEEDNVYYQVGIQYAEDAPDEAYDSLAVFMPGDYLKATDNGDGTYTCKLTSKKVSGYTAKTAPIVVPVNTPGYAAQEELSDYTDVSDYTDAGFVYVHIGARGRDAGAPAGVTDFKAGIRYIRYNEGVIAGDCDRIFTFGMSGGGAQSAVLGATGDSDLYNKYLKSIGAVMETSDAVNGSMCWCPITSLDEADEAYEWNMGSTRSGLSDEEQSISDELAKAYAKYINSAGFVDDDGNTLILKKSDDGIYQAGSYYQYIKKTIETSLNNFLADTTFPYDSDSATSETAGMPTGGGTPDGNLPNDTNGTTPTADAANQTDQNDNITKTEQSNSVSISGTYETAQDYIDALNANGTWVNYDADTNTATITSVADFVSAMKSASKSLGAFDQLDAGQGENILFGYGDGEGAHFDATLSSILSDLDSDYASDYKKDLKKTDSLDTDVQTRLSMYSPLYYLMASEDGYGTSKVASHWRIRTGIEQGDTSLCTEVNLMLALEANTNVSDVDFATVWGLGHTMAERTGDSTTNFIKWVNESVDD
ncbi:MAG: subtype A tannase [Catenisphaera adipataccumulans]|jgi:hypothetical protein|uniref:subtype A tannase n=1 Tax=Catenisphaera adipataccumulans TaxID=700500 RepID=UPI003D92F02A